MRKIPIGIHRCILSYITYGPKSTKPSKKSIDENPSLSLAPVLSRAERRIADPPVRPLPRPDARPPDAAARAVRLCLRPPALRPPPVRQPAPRAACSRVTAPAGQQEVAARSPPRHRGPGTSRSAGRQPATPRRRVLLHPPCTLGPSIQARQQGKGKRNTLDPHPSTYQCTIQDSIF